MWPHVPHQLHRFVPQEADHLPGLLRFRAGSVYGQGEGGVLRPSAVTADRRRARAAQVAVGPCHRFSGEGRRSTDIAVTAAADHRRARRAHVAVGICHWFPGEGSYSTDVADTADRRRARGAPVAVGICHRLSGKGNYSADMAATADHRRSRESQVAVGICHRISGERKCSIDMAATADHRRTRGAHVAVGIYHQLSGEGRRSTGIVSLAVDGRGGAQIAVGICYRFAGGRTATSKSKDNGDAISKRAPAEQRSHRARPRTLDWARPNPDKAWRAARVLTT